MEKSSTSTTAAIDKSGDRLTREDVEDADITAKLMAWLSVTNTEKGLKT